MQYVLKLTTIKNMGKLLLIYKDDENLGCYIIWKRALMLLTIFTVFFVFAKVNWQPVFGGVIIQFYFALIILRWDLGYEAFKWLGDRITEFLAYSDEGAKFVFGADFQKHFFAFKVSILAILLSYTG